MTRAIEVSAQAARDIGKITRVSRRTFGDLAAVRYRDLISAAIETLADEPSQRTAKTHDGGSRAAFLFHLRYVRQIGPDRVHEPRHLIVYTFDAEVLRVQRVLHDAMDLPRHIPPSA